MLQCQKMSERKVFTYPVTANVNSQPSDKLHVAGLSLWDAMGSHSASLQRIWNKEFPGELWTIVGSKKGRDLTLGLLLTLPDAIRSCSS